ncbi:hypothetical protein HDV05_005592 [Chytridiales sp. JEL 0842]|nr:hypothetical protein HDV05_005592 [Chytridiales sp. JEL 0842]
MSETFVPKKAHMDWDRLGRINLEKLLKNEESLEDELEALYPLLASVKIKPDDPRASVDQLIKLFRVTQLTMELKNMYLEGAEAQIKELEVRLKAEEETNRQRSRSNGAMSPSAELRALREENNDLERRNELLTRDLQRTEANMERETKYGQELAAALAEEKARYNTLSETTRQLQNDMKEREVQMVSQRHRLLSKNVEEEEFRVQLKEKNMEINRYLSEITALTKQNAHLSQEVDTIGQELEATVNELERNLKEQETAQEIIVENDKIIDALTEERDMLKVRLEEHADQWQIKQSKHEAAIISMKEDLNQKDKLLKEAQLQRITDQSQIERLTEELVNLSEERQSFNADAFRRDIQERDELIVGLRDKLEEAYKDFELLSLDWDKIDSLVKSKAGADIDGLRSQASLANAMREKVKALKNMHRNDSERLELQKKQSEEKERELVELRERIEGYEKGIYGLKDAVRETKQLKVEMSLRNKEIAELTKRINDLEVINSEAIEENEEMRRRLGIKPEEALELSGIRTIKSIELEKAKALNVTLQKEIDELESERVKLKDSLRIQALARGERAVAMGLSVEDLIAVEDYATRLRGGDKSSPGSVIGRAQRPVINNEQLQKLTIELERVHIESGEAREKLEKTEAQLRRLQDENRALEAVIKEVSTTLIKTRGINGGPSAAGDGVSVPQNEPGTRDVKPQPVITFPIIEKLLNVLDRKRHFELSRDISGNETVEDHLLQVNQTLREELAAMTVRVRDLETERDSVKHMLESSEKDAKALRLKAAKARGKVLELPAELLLGSVHDYSSVVEQLAECLLELQTKGKELKEARADLEKFQHFYSMLVSKQRLLYRDYQTFRKDTEEQISKLKDAKNEETAEKEKAEIRVVELERLVQHLKEEGDAQLRDTLVNTQRTVTLLKVNEVSLRRKYTSLAEVENLTRKENSKLKMDLISLDKVARETIGRLTRSKRELASRVDNLQYLLSQSVPSAELSAVRNSLELYTAKSRLLIERENQWIADRTRRDVDREELLESRERIQALQLKLYEAEEQAKKYRDNLLQMKLIKSEASAKDYLAEARHQLTLLEVAHDVVKKRCELAENKAKALEESEYQLKDRLDNMEKMYLETVDDNIKLRENEVEMKNKYEGGCGREEYQENLARIRELEESVIGLREEVMKYKDLADVASNQTMDLMHLHSADEKEKAILRAAVQELQMEGDDKLLIGKLHHHILALQMSEATALRKLEAIRNKCLRMETAVVRLEQAIDERDTTVFQIRLDSRQSLRMLQKTIMQLRNRVAGHVTLEKHERACELLRSIDNRKAEIEAQMKAFLEQKRKLEDDLAETDLKIKEQEELVAALKDESTVAQRISSWQSRMATLQISNLRISRELDYLKQEKIITESSLEQYINRVSALEEQITDLQIETDKKQMDWEKRQAEQDKLIHQYEDEREQIFKAASTAELKNTLPDKSLPVPHQLEAALRMLLERSRLLTAQEVHIATLESKVSSLTKSLEEAGERMVEKDSHITELRLTVANRDLRPGQGLSEADDETRSLFRKREGDAIRSAQEVIRSLRKQLAKKDELVERYRQMVQDIRREVKEREENDQSEITNLNEVINTLNDRQVEKLRNPHEVPQYTLNRDSEIDELIEDLRQQLGKREEEIATLREKFIALQESSHETKVKLEDDVSSLTAELQETKQDLTQCLDQLEVAQREVAALNTPAAVASESIKFRGLHEQIAKLSREVDKRDARITKMNTVIEELKATLIKTAEEAAESRIRQSNDSLYNSSDAINANMSKKVSQLQNKIDKLSKIIDENKRIEQSQITEISKLRSDVLTHEKNLAAQKDLNRSAQRALQEAKNKCQTLLAERDELRDKLERARGLNSSSLDSLRDSSASADIRASEESRRHEAEIAKERWEAEKKLRKSLDVMKQKLEDKNKEIDDLYRRESSLKEALSRMDRERSRLQQKVHTLSELPQAAVAALESQHESYRRNRQLSNSRRGGQQGGSKRQDSFDSNDGGVEDPDMPKSEIELHRKIRKLVDDKDALQSKILKMEAEVDEWKRVAEVDRVAEIEEIKLDCKQLQDKLQMMEELCERLQAGRATNWDGSGNDDQLDRSAKRGERSRGLMSVLESRIKDLMARIQAQEEEKLKMDGDLLEAKFEREKAASMADRMERRANELEENLNMLRDIEEEREARIAANIIPGLSVTLGQLRTSTSRLLANKSNMELESIIEHLSRVAEKLKTENDIIKKNGGMSNTKYMEMVKELKALRKEKTEALEMAKARSSADAQAQKVDAENTKLRRQLKKEAEKLSKSMERIQELEVTKESLITEIAKLRRAMGIVEDPFADQERLDGTQRCDSAEGDQHHHNLNRGGLVGRDGRARRVQDAEEIAYLKGQLAERDAILDSIVVEDSQLDFDRFGGSGSSSAGPSQRRVRIDKLGKRTLTRPTLMRDIVTNLRPSVLLLKKMASSKKAPPAPRSAAATQKKKRDDAVVIDAKETDDLIPKDKSDAKAEDIKKDLPNIILLIVLCEYRRGGPLIAEWGGIRMEHNLLQGVPLGLTFGSVPFLLKSKLSFSDIALFSLSSYPYSLKLLWSPIVDSLYFKSVGRRKSWIVPIQAITGMCLIFLGMNIDNILSSEHVPVVLLASIFTALVFLCATQDIAVDGWALTLLSEENKAYASTAQTIGLNSGYFLSFTVFLALNSSEFCNKYLRSVPLEEGILGLGSYLQFWGIMFLVCNAWLIFFQKEKPDPMIHDNEIQTVYKHIVQVCLMPHMKEFIFVLMIGKIGFMANDAVTALKLLETGFHKEDLALAVLIDFPLQLLFGYYAAKWSTGPKPLKPWLYAFYGRLFFAFLSMIIVKSVPKDGITTTFFAIVITCTVLSSFTSTVQFVGMGSFFTKISDPKIGGTYMTLLNTLSNLGGTWPKFFVLKAVDALTNNPCSVLDESEQPFQCNSDPLKAQCKSLGGTCSITSDGYYPVSIACVLIGILTLWTVIMPTVKRLEALPESAWRLEKEDKD